MATHVRSWLVGVALAAPLVLITGWLVRGALAPSPHVDREQVASPVSYAPRPTPAAGATTAAPNEHGAASWPPAGDLPASRLEERVDGGADALRAAGCIRLLYWRSDAPPADAEALVFDSADHARAAFAREAGDARTAGPGDEAQVSEQSVYFRRGAVLARVFADPGSSGGAALLALARRVESATAHADE